MIEELLTEYLSDYLSAPIFVSIPKDYPSSFLVIDKTGGAQVNHIKSATVAIQSYSKTSKLEAAQLNEDVKKAMLYDIPAESEIASIRLNSDYDFTDVTSKLYRYQAVFDIKFY